MTRSAPMICWRLNGSSWAQKSMWDIVWLPTMCPSRTHAPEDVRVLDDVVTHREERRRHTFTGQQVQNFRGVPRVRPVIEGQHQGAVCRFPEGLHDVGAVADQLNFVRGGLPPDGAAEGILQQDFAVDPLNERDPVEGEAPFRADPGNILQVRSGQAACADTPRTGSPGPSTLVRWRQAESRRPRGPSTARWPPGLQEFCATAFHSGQRRPVVSERGADFVMNFLARESCFLMA